MIVGYGRTCPKGYLPAFSVDTEEEAEELLALTCEMVFVRNEQRTAYIAKELEQQQTIPNLRKFGDRLAKAYAKMKQNQKRYADPV